MIFRMNRPCSASRLALARGRPAVGPLFCTTPQFWLNLQSAYDLSKAGDEIARDVTPRAA
jgi:hypothetical protein